MNQTNIFVVALAASLFAACSSTVTVENNPDPSSSTRTSATGSGGSDIGSTVVATSTTTTTTGGSSGTSTASATSTGSGEAPAPDEAVAYQITPSHTGALDTDTLAPPLTIRWTVDLGAHVSYPLIAGTRVFVTVGSPQVKSKLYALDQKTGAIDWGPVELDGTHAASYAAYENQKLFTVNFDGEVRAFTAWNAKMLWSTVLPSDAGIFTSAPTALGGRVYITGGLGAETMFVIIWSENLNLGTSDSFAGDQDSPRSALAAGGGALIVPWGNHLVALW